MCPFAWIAALALRVYPIILPSPNKWDLLGYNFFSLFATFVTLFSHPSAPLVFIWTGAQNHQTSFMAPKLFSKLVFFVKTYFLPQRNFCRCWRGKYWRQSKFPQSEGCHHNQTSQSTSGNMFYQDIWQKYFSPQSTEKNIWYLWHNYVS